MGAPKTARPVPVRNFNGIPKTTADQDFTISGVTRDSTGAVLGNCVIDLFRTADDSVAARTESDGSGNYKIYASSELTHYAVAYKAGSPDVAGTTVNTIVGT
jgi:hypothetical protein